MNATASTTLSKVRGLAVHTAALSLSNVSSILVGIVLVPLQARLLSRDVWGAWQLANRYVDVAHGLTEPGLVDAASRSAAADLDANYALIAARRTEAARRTALCLAAGGLGYIVAGVPLVGPMLLAAACAFPTLSRGSVIPDAWLAAKGAVLPLARLRVLQSLCGLAAIGGVLVSPASWTYALWLLGASVAASVLAYRTAGAFTSTQASDPALIEAGRRLSRARVLGACIALAEPFLLERLLGLSGLAAWGAAQIVVAYYKVLLGNVAASVSRRVYAQSSLAAKLALVLPWTRAFAAGSAVAALLLQLWGLPLFQLILSHRYPESARLGVDLTTAVLAIGVADFYGLILQSELDASYNTAFQLVAPAIGLVAIAVLGAWGGLTGVYLARLFAMGLGVLVRAVFMVRHVQRPAA